MKDNPGLDALTTGLFFNTCECDNVCVKELSTVWANFSLCVPTNTGAVGERESVITVLVEHTQRVSDMC